MKKTEKSEKAIRKEIELAIGGNGKTTLLANVSGQGVVGRVGPIVPGELTWVDNARHISFGLGAKPGKGKGAGFPDLIGWTEVEITPEMVGLNLAVFTGIEVKKENKKPSEIQQKRISLIRSAGGMAGVARSVEDAQEIINELDSRILFLQERDNEL